MAVINKTVVTGLVLAATTTPRKKPISRNPGKYSAQTTYRPAGKKQPSNMHKTNSFP